MHRRTTVMTMAVTLLASSVALAVPQSKPVSPDGAAPARATKQKTAKVGEAAPAFTLKDAAGTTYNLADYKGKIVVLQWINPDCPVCKGVTSNGTIQNMVKELKALDSNVVHLAINSTHYMEAEKSAAYLKQHKLEAPGLIDTDGTVGRLYAAKTTPHLYVIDGEGVLRYNGALDNGGRRRGGPEAEKMNYVVNAVRQIKAGETVAPDTMKPYGCSVKYAKGKGQGKGKGRSRRGAGRERSPG